MDLSHTLYWAVIALLCLTVGYQMGKLSLEVYDKWGKKEDNTLGTWAGMRIFLFPINLLNTVSGENPVWLVESVRKDHREGVYLLLNTLAGAPFRIAWFLFVVAVYYLTIPLFSLVVLLCWRILRDFGLSVVGLFTNIQPVAKISTETASRISIDYPDK